MSERLVIEWWAKSQRQARVWVHQNLLPWASARLGRQLAWRGCQYTLVAVAQLLGPCLGYQPVKARANDLRISCAGVSDSQKMNQENALPVAATQHQY